MIINCPTCKMEYSVEPCVGRHFDMYKVMCIQCKTETSVEVRTLAHQAKPTPGELKAAMPWHSGNLED